MLCVVDIQCFFFQLKYERKIIIGSLKVFLDLTPPGCVEKLFFFTLLFIPVLS